MAADFKQEVLYTRSKGTASDLPDEERLTNAHGDIMVGTQPYFGAGSRRWYQNVPNVDGDSINLILAIREVALGQEADWLYADVLDDPA